MKIIDANPGALFRFGCANLLLEMVVFLPDDAVRTAFVISADRTGKTNLAFRENKHPSTVILFNE